MEIILSDEVNHRADRRIELRLQGAGLEETCRLEDFDWSAAITLERRLLNGDGVPNAVQRPRGDLASVLADAPPATSPTHILDAPSPRARDAIAGPAWQPPEETWGTRVKRMVDRRCQGAGPASPPRPASVLRRGGRVEQHSAASFKMFSRSHVRTLS